VDDARDIADRRGGFHKRLNRVARRNVDGRSPDFETGIAQDLGRGIGVLLAQIGQQNMLARAHPPRNCLADRAGADHDDDVTHAASYQGQPPRRPSEEWGLLNWRRANPTPGPPRRRPEILIPYHAQEARGAIS
jgi:hypothetical protein